ncbi:4Fe-4S dicluster domain-containing protein [Spongiivirga sp. MCCC 1A20706]|uniref:4Fe-4S binding protein n=1 Tax=Spongiivirga sp. MCCC 1A20706 TaxID=3160963 RepID=UPI003977DB28
MSNKIDYSMSLATPNPLATSTVQKIALALGLTGLLILMLGVFNYTLPNSGTFLTIGILLLSGGIVGYAYDLYRGHPEGIKNNQVWQKSISSRGFWGWATGVILTTFYIILYFYPSYLGLGSDGKANSGVVALFDPLSMVLKGQAASQWFVYGTLYTVAILAFGYKFILKYRHNRYQIVRTISVMFFQLGFAFLIPEIMSGLNNGGNGAIPFYDLKNMWPLNYYLFYDWNIKGLLNAGTIGLAMLIFGVVTIFIISPILTYFYGKRWYCSWVCGCGGLAETAGDSFRQLSSKKMSAWKFERWSIHVVLVFAILMTVATVYSFLGKNSAIMIEKNQLILALSIVVVAIMAGVVILAAKKSTKIIAGLIGLLALSNLRWGFLTSANEVSYGVPSQSFFTYFVVTIFALTLAVLFYFKRKAFDKDAKYTAISIIVIIGGMLLMNHFMDAKHLFNIPHYKLQKTYGFLIGSVFSGVIGTGFYPILGNRSWCRFGCPMAAMLGMQQRLFSRFRISTNGGQCISCGNCSTYCEMGIDVRSYAQKGENIVRSSCVGCGICSAVCPRGVLKLENGKEENRINPNEILLGNDVDLMELVNNK